MTSHCVFVTAAQSAIQKKPSNTQSCIPALKYTQQHRVHVKSAKIWTKSTADCELFIEDQKVADWEQRRENI